MKTEEIRTEEEKPLPVRPPMLPMARRAIRWNREWPLRDVEVPEHYAGVEEYDPVLASHCRI